MRKIFTFAVVASAMFAFAGCTKDTTDTVNPSTDMKSGTKMASVTASIEQPTDETRTSLKNSNVLWTEGDQIGILLTSDANKNAFYTLKSGKDTPTGTFEGKDLGAGPKWAIYPVNALTNVTNDRYASIFLDTMQEYAEKSFGNLYNPMFGKSDENGNNLTFKNLCGAIRIKLTGTSTVEQILLTTTGEKISGYGLFDAKASGVPEVMMEESEYSKNYVSLVNIHKKLDPTTPGEFVIVLPAGTYAPGMKLSITTDTGDVIYKTTKSEVTVERSKVTPLASFDLSASELNFPDKIFRDYLVQKGFRTNAEGTDIDVSNAENIQQFKTLGQIDCDGQLILSLKGIENFTALKKLVCTNNRIANLDVSKNTALETLYCGSNRLSALDISENTALETLYCEKNKLTSLDVTKSTKLTTLYCEKNKLTSLDVTKSTKLTTLYCESNKLSALDVTKNTELVVIGCQLNQIEGLNLLNNKSLQILRCNDNKLTSLDLRNNTKISQLSCYKNHITKLDLTNSSINIEYMYIGTQTDVNTDGPVEIKAYVSAKQTTALDMTNKNNTGAMLLWETPPAQ